MKQPNDEGYRRSIADALATLMELDAALKGLWDQDALHVARRRLQSAASFADQLDHEIAGLLNRLHHHETQLRQEARLNPPLPLQDGPVPASPAPKE